MIYFYILCMDIFSLIAFSTFIYVMITTEYLDCIEHLAIERWPIFFCVMRFRIEIKKREKKIYGDVEVITNFSFFYLGKGEKTLLGKVLCK